MEDQGSRTVKERSWSPYLLHAPRKIDPMETDVILNVLVHCLGSKLKIFFRYEHRFLVHIRYGTWNGNGIRKRKGIYDLCPIFFWERNSYRIWSIRNHPVKHGPFLFLLRKRREIVLQWKKRHYPLILEKN